MPFLPTQSVLQMLRLQNELTKQSDHVSSVISYRDTPCPVYLLTHPAISDNPELKYKPWTWAVT